ncbi:hypothetical protein PDJAM_G00105120 [Pangasius djambal]|uniref:Uncharacterized protein n=1 Tax=Pangasius djambal TaxID=1691987 RepID=A0ACC5Y2V8_9TELE|nr:hypothetical protein [Pangasius djambal]
MAICAQSSSLFWLFSVQTVLLLCVSWPGTATLRFPHHYTMMHWASRIEKELEKVLPQVTGAHQMKTVSLTAWLLHLE